MSNITDLKEAIDTLIEAAEKVGDEFEHVDNDNNDLNDKIAILESEKEDLQDRILELEKELNEIARLQVA